MSTYRTGSNRHGLITFANQVSKWDLLLSIGFGTFAGVIVSALFQAFDLDAYSSVLLSAGVLLASGGLLLAARFFSQDFGVALLAWPGTQDVKGRSQLYAALERSTRQWESFEFAIENDSEDEAPEISKHLVETMVAGLRSPIGIASVTIAVVGPSWLCFRFGQVLRSSLSACRVHVWGTSPSLHAEDADWRFFYEISSQVRSDFFRRVSEGGPSLRTEDSRGIHMISPHAIPSKYWVDNEPDIDTYEREQIEPGYIPVRIDEGGMEALLCGARALRLHAKNLLQDGNGRGVPLRLNLDKATAFACGLLLGDFCRFRLETWTQNGWRAVSKGRSHDSRS